MLSPFVISYWLFSDDPGNLRNFKLNTYSTGRLFLFLYPYLRKFCSCLVLLGYCLLHFHWVSLYCLAQELNSQLLSPNSWLSTRLKLKFGSLNLKFLLYSFVQMWMMVIPEIQTESKKEFSILIFNNLKWLQQHDYRIAYF